MNKITLPNTTFTISRLCLGTANYGTSIDEADAFALMGRYAALGGNILDTANIYGKWGPDGIGTSEIVIGNWLKTHGNRDEMILCTKGAHPELVSMQQHRMTLKELKDDLHESLENLGADHVELFYLHRDALEVPVGEIADMLYEIRESGLAAAVGVSNWAVKRIQEAEDYAKNKYGESHFLTADQMMWNLAVSNQVEPAGAGTLAMNEDLFAFHQQTGMAVFAYSSQARGFFTKALQEDFDSNGAYESIKKAYLNPETEKRLKLVREIAKETGAEGTQVALAWLLNQPFTTVPIIGCRTVEQVESSFGALNSELLETVADKVNSTIQ